MCYDAKTQLRRQIKDAIHLDNLYEAQALKLKLLDLEEQFDQSGLQNYYHHVSGFSHPLMFIYTNDNPLIPTLATWGLIPEDCQSKDDALKIRNMTLNARFETISKKKSYAPSFENKRCVVYFEGFYEHHHKNGKTYPYLIGMKNGDMMPMAGLYADWIDQETGEEMRTFSIVTTVANSVMNRIHNNPKSSEGPRMPVILIKENIMKWLTFNAVTSKIDQDKLIDVCVPIPSSDLVKHTVGKLRGKSYAGNVPEIANKVVYNDLGNDQGILFQ